MSRERDIRQAVVDLLTATGEFHAVSLGDSDPRGQSASDLRLATVDPQDSQSADQSDDELIGQSVLDCRVAVTVSVRMSDPKLRDDAAERLVNVVRNALNGQCLADLTLPGWTKVKRWSWRKATADQRDVVLSLSTRYFEDGWNDADVAD